MADAITSFFLLQANRTGGANAVPAPSALELGSDTLTRNPRLETLGKLFTPPSGASNIAGLDSFLAVATAAKTGTTPVKTPGKDAPTVRKNDTAALDIFIKRETSAEARLKELLQASTATAPAAANTSPEEESGAAPAITRNTLLRVEEGGTGVIDSKRLTTSIPGARPQDIIYTLNDGPRHGRLELAAKPGQGVTTFTQQDLNLGRLRYVSDGSETRGDSFDFTVSGGEEELSGRFSIAVTPVNDTPTVDVNAGLTLVEGSTSTITAAVLSASDPDNLSTETVFTVTQGPQYGRLEFADNAGASISSFTQADINTGRLRYVNDGSENTADSFTFIASDGSAVTNEESFAITITPVDDAPVPAVNTGATLDEGGSAVLAQAQLNTTDVDTAASNITYNVTAAPANGRLEFTDNAGTAITSFTQADINAGRIRYVNDGSETTSDSFSFTVTDGTTGLSSQAFNFAINPVDDAPVATTNTGVTTAEGGTAAITASQLNTTDVDTARSNITYAVTSGPVNGRLEFTDNAGVSVSSFTQQDLDSGRLRYVHNGSETTSDSFTFTTSDATTTLSPATFGISVTPVNDAPTAGNNTGATVSWLGSTIITSARLSTNDVDTAAANLTYTVTNTPNNGRLELVTNPGQAITSFTQADIDAGRVRYVHTNFFSLSDQFRYTVSDGQYSLPQRNFNISVN